MKMIRMVALAGGFAALAVPSVLGEDVRLTPPAEGAREVVTVDPKGADRVVVKVDVPVCDVQEMWMPSWIVPRQDRKWWIHAESAPQCDMPYVAYFNTAGRNAFSIGSASLGWDTQIGSKINQEKGVWEVTMTVVAGPEGKLEPFAVTLDRRPVGWTDALADWRASLNLPKRDYPEAAWKPVYCSWYAVHAAMTEKWVDTTAGIAANLGFKTFILDDGWSYDDAKRVNPETIKTWYQDTGTWDKFSTKKFPDFKKHRRWMRSLGLNYLVWVSPYFVGTRSELYKKGGFDQKGLKPFEGNVLADPTDRAFMDSVDDQLVRLMKEADLDGLKIDFLDYILPSVEKPRGAASLAYVERLMKKLRAVKPDGLFEFRQNYATPLTAHLATQFRAGDVPFEWLANFLCLAQIRVTMGDGVPVHADPIFWSATETPDNINRHFLAAMAGVPMLSMDLEKMSVAERTTVRRWLDFYTAHVERFQKSGSWRVDYKNGGVAAVSATLGDEAFVIVNDADFVPRLARRYAGKKLTVANLTYETADFGSGVRVPPAEAYVWREHVAAGTVFVGQATSMEKLRPRAHATPAPATEVKLALARGETEAMQLFVRPEDRDLTDVTVRLSALKGPKGALLPAKAVKVSVVGYVDVTNETPYAYGQVGWWPDPILDYLDKTDVKAGDLQGFWLSVKAPRDQAAGVYSGTATVVAGNEELVRLPVAVRIYGFEVPAKTPLPMAITFDPEPSYQHAPPSEVAFNDRLRADPETPVNCWKRHEDVWADFLADHYVTFDNLYHRGGEGYPKIEALRKLADEGRLDCFNLGYWGYPKSLSADDKTAWRTNTFAALTKSWEKVKAAGLEKYAYVYGCDEISTNFFPQIRWAIAELKKAFPGVPVSTTAYDHDFGTGDGLKEMDWFTPLTPKFDVEKAARSREAGHRVWWYTCCCPLGAHANTFIEYPAIHGRLLMGAMTAKYRPDGYLYYQISLWNSLRPISGTSAFTDWTARSWTTYNGDGSWVCAGPDGTPLSTVRFENFRDGLEDYAYAKLLEQKLAADPSAPWAAEAKRLLAVPQDLVKDKERFTSDPAAVYAWRNALAEILER